MAALADLSAFVNRSTGGTSGLPENIWYHKGVRIDNGVVATASPMVNRPYSLWRHDGIPVGAGASPTTWANPGRATVGGLLQVDPTGGRQKWLTHFSGAASQAGTLLLVDRLGHNGNLSGTSIAAQTFTGTATRHNDATSSVGNALLWEMYTSVGVTATTITASYTNQGSTAGRTTVASIIGATGAREPGSMGFMPLQSGDTGVISVQSATVLASTGTAGAFGITLVKPLAYLPVNQTGVAGWRDFTTGLPGLVEIKTDACLSLIFICQTSFQVMELYGCVSTVEN